MQRKALLLVAVVCGAMVVAVPAAQATPPGAVTITIDETFNAPPTTPTVTGVITATGGVFGTAATGTLASLAFKPVGWAVKYPFHDHLFVYTATDQYTFAGGGFLINFEASCILTSIDFATGDTVAACSGNWRVNGGTGDYSRLRGTGTFTETQELNAFGAGTGFITLIGVIHID